MTARRVNAVIECLLVLAVLAGTYRLAAGYAAAIDQPQLADWELKPAVMLSCGFGFVEPGGISAERDRFLVRKSGSISCEQFAWGGAPTPAIAIAADNRYSIYGVAWALKLGGASWATIDAYLAALFALSMAAIYGLYRLAAGRAVALAGVAAVACSTLLAEIVVLRDFVKLPCFAILWFGLGWVIKSGFMNGARAMMLPLATSGAFAGLSIGLRMDALVFVPVFPAIAAVAMPGFTRRDLALKAAGCAAFVAAFLVTGVPILRALSGGSNSSHVVVLGLMQEFDRGLGIVSTPYDMVGWHYSDGLAYSVIASYGLLKEGAKMPIFLGSPEYDAIGNHLIVDAARHFPADFMARGLAATAQIFTYPFERRVREQSEKLATFQESPVVRAITRWRSTVLAPFAGRELFATLAVLALASAFNWRLGVLGAFLVLYFCGYALLQFSRRHVFHLDVIPIFVAVLAFYLPVMLGWRIAGAFRRDREEGLHTRRRFLREFAIGTAALALLLLTGTGALAATRRWQQGHVTAMLDRTIASGWTEEATADEPLALTSMIGERPSPTWWPLYIERPDLKTAVLIRTSGVVPRGKEAEAAPDLRPHYFMVVLSNACRLPEVTLVPAYTAADHTVHHEFIRPFTIPVTASAPSRLLMPVYYHLGPNWSRLDGFAVPAAERACVTGVFRAVAPSSLPMPVLSAALAPDWRTRPLYQQVLTRSEASR